MGYTFNVGPECEFFLFQTDNNGNPTTIPHDNGTYFDLGPADMGENARREICLTLEDMGFEIETSHHEKAPGQHEVDFKYGEALRSADNIMTLKLVVKTVAQRNGLFASFMPKPLNGVNGSGMHTNFSLFKNGANAFYDPADKNGLSLSKDAYMFMTGVIKHARGMAVVTNPVVNSYKRLISGFGLPYSSVLDAAKGNGIIRIPKSMPDNTRIELKFPDAACNPYLEFAAILSAGLDGIEKSMELAESLNGGIYEMPGNLGEAIAEFKKDNIIQRALGSHIAAKYTETKQREWEEYQRAVTDWEVKKYLNVY